MLLEEKTCTISENGRQGDQHVLRNPYVVPPIRVPRIQLPSGEPVLLVVFDLLVRNQLGALARRKRTVLRLRWAYLPMMGGSGRSQALGDSPNGEEPGDAQDTPGWWRGWPLRVESSLSIQRSNPARQGSGSTTRPSSIRGVSPSRKVHARSDDAKSLPVLLPEIAESVAPQGDRHMSPRWKPKA
jgi:hypothetical protein